MTGRSPSPHDHPRLDQPAHPGDLAMRSARELDAHTITLSGELDLATAADVERELLRVEATDAAMILIDLAGVTFLDGTGVRLLILADARSRANGDRLKLRRASEQVQRVLRICGIADRLPFAER
jgi:anti-sigma B factor antagonist